MIKLGTRFRVEMQDVFSHRAYFRTVEPDNDFERLRSKSGDPQKRDKDTGERLWVVTVLDGDPEARTAEVKVRIVAPVQPVPPSPPAGSPFPEVEFDGLTVMPWVDGQRCKNRRADDRECRGRVAYSLRATGMGRGGGAPPDGPRSGGGDRPGRAFACRAAFRPSGPGTDEVTGEQTDRGVPAGAGAAVP